MGFFADRRARINAEAEAMAERIAIRTWRDPATPLPLLMSSMRSNHDSYQYLAANPALPMEILETLAQLSDPAVQAALATNPTWNNRDRAE